MNKIFLKIKKTSLWIALFLFAVVIFDIFLIPVTSDVFFFGVIGLYVLLIFIANKIKSSLTLRFTMLLLIIMFIRYVLFGPDGVTEEIAVWFVLFLLIGVIQKWREI